MLIIKGLTKYFAKNSPHETLALDNFDLRIKKGDFVTIIGSNGAGKSTLLNLIAGTLQQDKGEINLSGKAITCQLSLKREKRGLRLGINKNLRNFFREKLSELNLGLEDNISKKVGLLSGGQRQAMTMLMATMFKPKVILLDEHTASLDPESSKKILKLTNNLVKERQGDLITLMVTHNMKQALEVGNRTVMMDRGRNIFDIQGEKREKINVDDLVRQFSILGNRKDKYIEDRMVLI